MEKKTMEVTMIKQTSIDLLLEKIYIEYKLIPNDDIIEQAKAMHKEEIEDALDVGYQIANEDVKFKHIHTAEQYYNDTFGGEKQC